MTNEQIEEKINELNELIEKRMNGEQSVSHNGTTVTHYSLSELLIAKEHLEKRLSGGMVCHKVHFSQE